MEPLRCPVPPRLDAAAVDTIAAAVAAARDAARPLLLEGGADFCEGLDLAVADLAAPGPALRAYARALAALRTAPVPTIAVVRGRCLGGGLGLAAACDVLLAADTARFGLPEALLGLVPAIVAPVLAERVPAQRLRLLALRGATLDAAEAHALGLVDGVAPEADLPRRARAELRALGRAAPASVALLKAAPELPAALLAGAALTEARLADPAVAAAAARLASGDPGWRAP